MQGKGRARRERGGLGRGWGLSPRHRRAVLSEACTATPSPSGQTETSPNQYPGRSLAQFRWVKSSGAAVEMVGGRIGGRQSRWAVHRAQWAPRGLSLLQPIVGWIIEMLGENRSDGGLFKNLISIKRRCCFIFLPTFEVSCTILCFNINKSQENTKVSIRNNKLTEE